MKIARIQRIRNCRIFRDFLWPRSDLPDFGRFNLIYGWNSSGKTTLSDLFRHLQVKEPIVEGDVQFVVDGNIINGSSLATITSLPIRVFNRDAVDRIVFENPDKEFPPIFVLGEESGEKQRQVEQLQKEAAKAAADQRDWESKKSRAETAYESFCEDRAREIKNLLTTSGGGPYNNYNKSDLKNTAEELNTTKPPGHLLTVEEREKCLSTKSGVPKERIEPLSAQLPDLALITEQVEKVLGRSIQSKVLEELVSDPVVAAWVNQGLPLHSGHRASDKCRFCGQPLPKDRLNQLQAHFNDEFNRFQGEVDALMEAITSAKESVATLQLPARALLYPHFATEYGEQVRILKGQSEIVGHYFEALSSALEAKKKDPFTALTLPPFLTSANPPAEPPGTLEKIFQAVFYGLASLGNIIGQVAYKRINELISKHNELTDNFSKEIENARRSLEKDEVLKVLSNYRAKLLSIDEAKKGLTNTNKRVQNIQKQTDTIKQAIRNHQKPANELNKEMAAYLGRDELRFDVRDTGYAISRKGQPAMHLSESERTAIAFMYFLKTLNEVGFDLKTGVVVVDDPVSSLDANSLFSAFGYMKERTRTAGQLFVLTHNFSFFRQVKNWYHHLPNQNKKDLSLRPARFYQLNMFIRDGQREASLAPLDPLLEQYESEYHYIFKKIYEEAERDDTGVPLDQCYSLPNLARRLVEAFLSFRYPAWAGDISTQLDRVEFDIAKKIRILRFIHTYSHHGYIPEPEHDPFILAETRAILADVLKLIEVADPEHFRGMKELVAPSASPEEVV
jgi:wobble nucleotide-excising tRNase